MGESAHKRLSVFHNYLSFAYLEVISPDETRVSTHVWGRRKLIIYSKIEHDVRQHGKRRPSCTGPTEEILTYL